MSASEKKKEAKLMAAPEKSHQLYQCRYGEEPAERSGKKKSGTKTLL